MLNESSESANTVQLVRTHFMLACVAKPSLGFWRFRKKTTGESEAWFAQNVRLISVLRETLEKVKSVQ